MLWCLLTPRPTLVDQRSLRSHHTLLPYAGVRYPGHLLPEVVAVLSAQQEQAQHGGSGGLAAPLRRRTGACGTWGGWGRKLLHGPLLDARCLVPAAWCRRLQNAWQARSTRLLPSPAEHPTPVDPKALKKAFTAPKSITDFFKPRGGAAAGAGLGESAVAAAGHKRGAADAAAAPVAKRQAAKAGSNGAKGGIAAAFSRSQQQQQQQQAPREQQGAPGPLVDLAAGDESSCDAGGSTAAGGVADGVLRASSRLNGSGASKGEAWGGVGAAAVQPSSGGRPDPAGVEVLTAMGFTAQQAERALRVTCGDVERAANWILMGN